MRNGGGCRIIPSIFQSGKHFNPQSSTFPSGLRSSFGSMISNARLVCCGLRTFSPMGRAIRSANWSPQELTFLLAPMLVFQGHQFRHNLVDVLILLHHTESQHKDWILRVAFKHPMVPTFIHIYDVVAEQLRPIAAALKSASCRGAQRSVSPISPICKQDLVAGWTPEQVLVAVMDPNRAVESCYLSFTATLNDGQARFGITSAESPRQHRHQGPRRQRNHGCPQRHQIAGGNQSFAHAVRIGIGVEQAGPGGGDPLRSVSTERELTPDSRPFLTDPRF